MRGDAEDAGLALCALLVVIIAVLLHCGRVQP